MDITKHERSLEELFEFTSDSITEPYEVVRTIGFTLNCKSGAKRFRLEAIRFPGKANSSVLVWKQGDDGKWDGPSPGQPTLDLIHPDLSLREMVKYIRQHYAQY